LDGEAVCLFKIRSRGMEGKIVARSTFTWKASNAKDLDK